MFVPIASPLRPVMVRRCLSLPTGMITVIQLEYKRRLITTLRPSKNGRRFPDIFKCIFLNENVRLSIKISLKFVPKGQINNITALVQIMAWRRPGAKPLSEPMLVWSLTHICVTRPQWVNRVALITRLICSKILTIDTIMSVFDMPREFIDWCMLYLFLLLFHMLYRPCHWMLHGGFQRQHWLFLLL